MNFTVTESLDIKQLSSDTYNYVFNKSCKTMSRWGENKKDNPVFSPYGPEVVYVEISDNTFNLFKYILELASSTKTLCLVVAVCDSNKEQEVYEKIYPLCAEYGLELTFATKVDTSENTLFSLCINKDGEILCKERINILKIDNLVKDIWYSQQFKTERYEQIFKGTEV